MRDAGEWPAFREFTVDSIGFRAYVRPLHAGEGFVTMLYTEDRDRRLADLDDTSEDLAFGLAAGCILLGLGVSRLMVTPVRKVLGDQQAFWPTPPTRCAPRWRSSWPAAAERWPATGRAGVRAPLRRSLRGRRASTGVNEMPTWSSSGQMMPRMAPLRLTSWPRRWRGEVDDVEIVRRSATVVVQADMALLRQAVENVVRNASRRATRGVADPQRPRRRCHRVRDNRAVRPGDPCPACSTATSAATGGQASIGLAIVRAIAGARRLGDGGQRTRAGRCCGRRSGRAVADAGPRW